LAALTPAVWTPSRSSVSASVGRREGPTRGESVNTGSAPSTDGNENGVQLPCANARSNRTPPSASSRTLGIAPSASARNESTVTSTTPLVRPSMVIGQVFG